MAELHPTLEKLSELDNQPSEGERFLLEQLQNILPEDFEVYYKPVFNGEVIDIVILRKSCGVALIKVRDWNLGDVTLDSHGQWIDVTSGNPLIAPDRQVNGYKWNMFNLHISGLAEKAALNENFRKVVHPYVFFSRSTKKNIDALFEPIEAPLKEEKLRVNNLRKNGDISDDNYDEKMDKLDRRTKTLIYSKAILITEENLKKVEESLQRHILFADGIYNAFKEYLRPKYHQKNDGIPMKFTKKQFRLVDSKPGFQKIKGVAGSGKTTMLAARAVNAHLRHGGRILILTFNKALRNFIHQRIGDVPENFDTSAIDVSNYHSFINMNLSHCGLRLPTPSLEMDVESHFERMYANESMFSGFEEELLKYDSIFLDEVQDYQPEWIKIIRRFFLKEGGEMVLYGDEGQNIYGRDLKGPRSILVQGFGNWERLTRSMRSQAASPLTNLVKNFQERYLLSKYDIDLIETDESQELFNYDLLQASVYHDNKPRIDQILSTIRMLLSERIKPENITILCTNIELLRKCEKDLLDKLAIETMTTFESEDSYQKLAKRYDNNELLRCAKDIRGSKKLSFDQSSPFLKMSTVHSYKGMDSNTIVFVVMPEDNEELIYTGMTRSKQNLLLHIPVKSRFSVFFQTQPSISIVEIAAPQQKDENIHV